MPRAVVAVLVGALLCATPSHGEEEVAKALLQSGKGAYEKKDFAQALKLLEQAGQEQPDLREVDYWRGAAYDKLGKVQEAVRAWRAFRAAAGGAPGAAPPSKAEVDLLKKAEARLLVLAPGEGEAEKLEAAFATDMLAFAKSRQAKDPAAAWMALDLLLKADPSNGEAAAAAARLRAPRRSGEVPLPPAMSNLDGWQDLIAARFLGEATSWTYGDRLLTLDIGDQSIPGPPSPLPVGGRCGMDMEFRLLNASAADWGVGFVLLDARDTQLLGVQVGAKELVGFRGPPQGPLASIAKAAVPSVEPRTWHRLSVQVLAPKVVAYLDGEKITQFAADNLGPESHLRLFVKRCKVEMRTLRWTPLP